MLAFYGSHSWTSEIFLLPFPRLQFPVRSTAPHCSMGAIVFLRFFILLLSLFSCTAYSSLPPSLHCGHGIRCRGDGPTLEYLFPGDNHWYRAQFLDGEGTILTVWDVDWNWNRQIPLPLSEKCDFLYSFKKPVHGFLSLRNHGSNLSLFNCSTGSWDFVHEYYNLPPCESYCIYYTAAPETKQPPCDDCSVNRNGTVEWKLKFDEYGNISLISFGLSHHRKLRTECFDRKLQGCCSGPVGAGSNNTTRPGCSGPVGAGIISTCSNNTTCPAGTGFHISRS